MRPFFKPFLFILGLLLFTFGCQKEEFNANEDLGQETNFQSLRGSIFESDSIIKTNKELFRLIDSNFSSNNSFEVRHITSEIYGFSIDTSNVQLIESDFYESYTFVIHRDGPNDNVLENYVATFFNNGHYSQNIITYPRDNDTGEYDISSATATLISDISLLERGSGDCEGFSVPVTEWDPNAYCVPMACKSNAHMGEVQQGECELSGSEAPYDKCYGGWVSGCSSGSVGGGPDPGDGDPNTGGNVPDGDPDPDIGVTPLEDKYTQKERILNCINGASLGESVTIDENFFNSILFSLGELSQIENYLDDNNCSEEAQVLASDFLKIKETIPNAKFMRFKELLVLLENDEWALIQDCAEQNGLNTADYLELYNLQFPEECTNKLNSLGEDYFHQPISDGNVPLANIDYYSVEITEYPDFNNDGIDDSPEEIFNKFREKFTELASGEKDNFESECNVPADTNNTIDIWWQFNPLSDSDSNLFNSDNPISSIMLIDAGANNPFVNLNAELGAIMVSDFTSNNLTISTIHTPETETQPFSGNRQWGWIINQNGNLEIFTRAVDVARVADIFLEWPATWLGSNIECQQETYYDIADATWQNMQDKIKIWIEDEGDGIANINTPVAIHIDKEKIEEILTTNGSIAEILSNCN